MDYGKLSSTRTVEKTAEAIGGFIDNATADTTKSQKLYSRIMLKSKEERQKSINDLRLIY